MNRRLLPLNSLRAFEATGVHHSFTKAAEALSVTQSAVSRHVKSLEADMGVSLFMRLGKQGLQLTDAGQGIFEDLIPRVRKLEQQLLSCLSAEEQKTLTQLMSKVRRNAELINQQTLNSVNDISEPVADQQTG